MSTQPTTYHNRPKLELSPPGTTLDELFRPHDIDRLGKGGFIKCKWVFPMPKPPSYDEPYRICTVFRTDPETGEQTTVMELRQISPVLWWRTK